MYGTSSHWTDHSRERQLWCAVIDRALQDATRHPADWTALTKEQARERAEARRWFAENSAHFRHACESARSEEHTSELQSLMRISYAVFCLKKKKNNQITNHR